MAEKLCTLRTKGGGGGKYTETSLWTNSAPTSSFAAQAVTLSDSMDNYKYLRVRYRMSTTDANEYSCIFLVNDIKHSSASTNVPQFSVVARTNTTYVRTFYYVSGTSLQMNVAYVMNNTGNVTNVAIPLEILGLNELKPGTDVGLVTNGASFSAKTSVTINCKVGDYIALGYARSASGYNVYWNGTVAFQSSDYVTGYTLSTNNFMSIMKASQTSNTFSVASGATLTGGYQIFSLG